MPIHDGFQRNLEGSFSDNACRHPVGAGAPQVEDPVYPELGDVVRLVDEALAMRRAEAVVAHLRARLPAHIERARAGLSADLLRASERGYRRLELHHSALHGYQILAMVWGPGQGTPIHDHQDFWGLEAVVLGELQVARYRIRDLAGDALRLEPSDVIELRGGDIEVIDADHGLHLCRNPSARAVTVSLHIYGRPLDPFGVYLDEGDGWYRRREHYPRIESATT